MTQSFVFTPSGDVENDGWTLVGANVTEMWEALGYYEYDDCYVMVPAYRGGASVRFPIDPDDLPTGAIIDSVSVHIRMKTASGSGPRCVTVNVMSSENTSRYTTRTIYATNTFTDYQVGTYTKDPLGYAWDIHRLNKLRLRMFSLNNFFDSIRVSGLYVRVNFHTRPTVTVTSPSGTVNSPSPTVSWQYLQEEGEPQKKAVTKIFTATQAANASTFNPDTAPPVYERSFDGEASTYLLPVSLNPDSYVCYVQVTSQFGAKSVWAKKAFTITGSSPGIPGDDNTGISGTPGIGVPLIVPDPYTSSAEINLRDSSNLLSVQQADFEIATDPLEYIGSNATLARDTTQAFGAGEASMSITASSAANCSAVSTKIEVAENTPFTVRSQFKSGSTSRVVQVIAKFYDASHTFITEHVGAGSDSSTTWTEAVMTNVTPVGAVYCEVILGVVNPGNGEVHYVDHVGLMYGTNTAWSDGGHASRNMLSSFLATGDDPAPVSDQWVQANAATTTQRVTATGTGSHGSKTNQMTYTGTSGTLAFRAAGTVWSSPTSGKDFTLNKPAGLADNDLMIAFVTSNEHGTITPPAGWVLVNSATLNDGSTDIALHILKRTGLAADPSTWATGFLSVNSTRRTAVVMAYSGAAHADDQFIAENVRTDATGALAHRTQTITNTDPNAWRIAAFAASDDVTGGTFTANVTPPSSAAAIQFVGRAAKWGTNDSAANFRINRPSGVVSGDLMVATLACYGSITTVTAPSGWTLVRKTTADVSGGSDLPVTFAVFKRTAGSSEPSSWVGTLSNGTSPKITQASAYRNAADASLQFIDEDSSTDSNDDGMVTATVTNSESQSWRITAFGCSRQLTRPGQTGTPRWSSTEVSERSDDSQVFPDSDAVSLAMYDSNGVVSTGSHSRTGSLSLLDFSNAVAWIGIIKGMTVPPAQGSNETERSDNRNGSSNPWVSTAVYDSNGPVIAGAHSVYGQFSAGSGAAADSMASWIGFIRPADTVVAGTCEAYPNRMIDISEVDSSILELANKKVTITSTFLGNVSGTPTLSVEFFRANQKISEATAIGNTFNDTAWVKSWASFDIPDGTTRLRPVLGSVDRAVSDTVQFDRVGVMLGEPDDGVDALWRNGTVRAEHPIWAKPVIQYQDDDGAGYGEWTNLPGQSIRPPRYSLYDGLMSYSDHTIVPLNNRRYRVKTITHGLEGDTFASGWGPVSEEASFSALNWWLKDIHDLSNNIQLTVKAEPISVDTANTAAQFQPLGEHYPIVISEGFKADTFSLTLIMRREEHAALKRIFRTGRTLLLQSDVDYSWWVRPVGDINASTQLTGQRRTDPLRFIKVTFVQVAPEE